MLEGEDMFKFVPMTSIRWSLCLVIEYCPMSLMVMVKWFKQNTKRYEVLLALIHDLCSFWLILAQHFSDYLFLMLLQMLLIKRAVFCCFFFVARMVPITLQYKTWEVGGGECIALSWC